MKLNGKSIKELKRLERSLERDIRDTEETIAREEKRLNRLRQYRFRVNHRRRRLEYLESLRTPLFAD